MSPSFLGDAVAKESLADAFLDIPNVSPMTTSQREGLNRGRDHSWTSVASIALRDRSVLKWTSGTQSVHVFEVHAAGPASGSALPGYALCLFGELDETSMSPGAGEDVERSSAESTPRTVVGAASEFVLLAPERGWRLSINEGSRPMAWIEIDFTRGWLEQLTGHPAPDDELSLLVLHNAAFQDPGLELLVAQLCAQVRSAVVGRSLMLEGTFISIVGRLLLLAAARADSEAANHLSPEQQYHERVRLAVDYLQQHLHEKISLKSVAHAAGLSRSYLVRLFRQETGTSVLAYLNNLRVSRAKEMIFAHGRYKSLAEIAKDCGFANHAHLTRSFVHHVGKTPVQFRKEM